MGLYPVPPGQQDDRTKESLQGQDPSDVLLQEFIAALQQPPQATVQKPKPISTGDRIYMALRGAQDPEFRKRVVDPLLAERENYPGALAGAQESARQQRVKELGTAVAQTSLFNLRGEQAATEESKRTLNLAKAQKAFQAGGKPYTMDNVRMPDGSPGIEYGIVDPTTGERVPIGVRPKAVRGQIAYDATGNAVLADPTIRNVGGTQKPGAEFDAKGFPTQPPPPPGMGFSKPPTFQAVKEATSMVDLAAQFSEAERAFNDAVQADPDTIKQIMAGGIANYVGNNPALQPIFSRTHPQAAYAMGQLNGLSAVIDKVRTGNSRFSIELYHRLRTLVPQVGDNPDVAVKKFASLRRVLQAHLVTLQKLEPNLGESLKPAMEEATTNSVPAGITPGSVKVGRSKSTGRPLWRNPAGKLEME